MSRAIRRALTVAAVCATVTVAGAGAAAAGDYTCTVQVVAAPTPADTLTYSTERALVAQAAAFCAGYQGGGEPATLSLWVEYQPYYGAAFGPIPGCTASTTSPGVVGVHALVPPTVVCEVPPDSPAAGRPLRASASFTYGTRTYRGHSPRYLG